MKKYPKIHSAILLILIILIGHAAADIAPDPITGGMTIRNYEGEITDVRMVEEDVVVRIFKKEILTVAEFSMLNEGETVNMDVGFPYSYAGEFKEFRAYVNGHEVDVRDGMKENVGRKKRTVYWKLWNMTFDRGESYNIRVEYKTKPYEMSILFHGRDRYASMPTDTLDKVERLTRSGNASYWLDTGKHWKGKLDRCRVTFELVGKSDDNIRNYWPRDGKLTGSGVVWDYYDYEPQGRVTARYFPNMAAKDIPLYLCGIIELYPDDPRLASDIGSSILSQFNERELMYEIYHSFLARWDGHIPQLMEYASGGRCRFMFKDSGGEFYTMWRMARILFDEYEKRGKLEKLTDVAPAVSKISKAIADSLDTCGNLPENSARLFSNAKELLDISNSLINDED